MIAVVFIFMFLFFIIIIIIIDLPFCSWSVHAWDSSEWSSKSMTIFSLLDTRMASQHLYLSISKNGSTRAHPKICIYNIYIYIQKAHPPKIQGNSSHVNHHLSIFHPPVGVNSLHSQATSFPSQGHQKAYTTLKAPEGKTDKEKHALKSWGCFLVGGFSPTHLKNMQQSTWESFPQVCI